MRELAIQSASDTLVNTDRSKIQEEINQLRSELTRIAETTEFNTRKLLDGSIAQSTGNEAFNAQVKQSFRGGGPELADFLTTIDPSLVLGKTLNEDQTVALVNRNVPGFDEYIPTVDVAFEIKVVSYQTTSSSPVSIALEVHNSVSGFLYSLDPNDPNTFTDQGGFEATIASNGNLFLHLSMNPPGATTSHGNVVGYVNSEMAFQLTLSDIGKTTLIQVTPQRAAVTTDNALTFQVGANEGQFLKMGIQDMRASALRMETLNVLGTNDQDSRLKAQNAIGAIDQALEYVNTNRARLGAFQNRVEYTIQNLQVARENLAASESRIRDTDIAAETANLTRAQILVQAGTAILSQANVSPQSALSLLG